MSTPSKWLPAPPDNFSTTLNGSIAANALSIVLNSATGLGTEGIGVIYAKDSTGTAIASSIEIIHWTNLSGSTLTLSDSGDRGLSGSYSGAQTHSNGDTFEVWVTSPYYSGPRTSFLTDHNDAGTHKINVVDAERYAVDAAGSDTYAITLAPAPSAYAAGMFVHFLPATSNTGACTLNVNSLGAKSIKYLGQDPQDGHIVANMLTTVVYDGTNFQLVSPNAPISLGYAQITSSFTTTTAGSYADITGLSVTVTIPAGGRRVRITGFSRAMNSSQASGSNGTWVNIVEDSTQIGEAVFTQRTSGDSEIAVVSAVKVASAGSHTYKLQGKQDAAGTYTFQATATAPAYILVELL